MVPWFESWGVTGVFELLLQEVVGKVVEGFIESRFHQSSGGKEPRMLNNFNKRRGKLRSHLRSLMVTILACGAGVTAAHWLP